MVSVKDVLGKQHVITLKYIHVWKTKLLAFAVKLVV